MFQALQCPSSGARDDDDVYHIGRFVLGLLYVEGEVQLGLFSVRVAGSSTRVLLQPATRTLLSLTTPHLQRTGCRLKHKSCA